MSFEMERIKGSSEDISKSFNSGWDLPSYHNSRMSETENATGAASRGRKLQSARVGTLKSSIVQYWDK